MMNDAARNNIKLQIPVFLKEFGICLEDLQCITTEMILERNLKPKDANFDIRMRRIESKVNGIIELMEREKKGI